MIKNEGSCKNDSEVRRMLKSYEEEIRRCEQMVNRYDRNP